MAIQKLAVVATAVVCVVGVSVGIGWRGRGDAPSPSLVPAQDLVADSKTPPKIETAEALRSEVEDPLAWTANFVGPEDEEFGSLHVQPHCPECGTELPCPDHVTKLPTPKWALEEGVPRSVRSTFYHLPKFLQRMRESGKEDKTKTANAMCMAYGVGTGLDKWLKGDVMNSGLWAGAWDNEDILPSPLPNMNGEQPGDPGWSEFVGTFNGEYVISWHHTEYPEWKAAWEAYVFAEDPMVACHMSNENWELVMQRTEMWYAWACEQVELAKGN